MKTLDANSNINILMATPTKNIEKYDNVCCGGTHNKKIAVKVGVEWPNEWFPLWMDRVEGSWSQYTDSFTTANVITATGHKDMKMYFWTKSDHAITTASMTFASDVSIRNQHGDWIALDTNYTAFVLTYYPYVNSLKGYMFDEKYTTYSPTRHSIAMTMTAIN